MRLLHVITTLDVGGAEMALLSHVRGQTARGHAVRVAYLKGHGTLTDDFREAGAERVERIGSGPAAPARLWPHARWADVVHSHLLKADALSAVVALAAGRRGALVAGKHNDEQVLKRPLVSLAHGLLGGLAPRTIALSEHVADFTARHGRIAREKIAVVPYGIDPAPFEAAAAAGGEALAEARRRLGIEPDDVVFVCVARFAPQKAHDVLLRGFAAAARAAAVPLRLLLVGDDPFGDGRRRAEALSAELALGPRAIFTGIRRDVPALLALSDVFVMSSLWEGLGLVFLEAMAAGKPVLATRVSAVPEVVEEGRTGLLVPPGDPDALAEAMVRLAGSAELRDGLGRAGRERVSERFSLDAMVERTLAVYRELPAREGERASRP